MTPPRCASCLRYFGPDQLSEARTSTFADPDGSNPRTMTVCVDRQRCDRQWTARNAPDPWAEPDPNDEGDDIHDVGEVTP